MSWTQDRKVRNVQCSLAEYDPAVQTCYEYARGVSIRKKIGNPDLRDKHTKMSLYITNN
ncbi:MAG: hypothetical protein P4L69_00040 [Desulfosporosinus sp.]|nr:hypothetical protein [Desulfosporosinus sp.]